MKSLKAILNNSGNMKNQVRYSPDFFCLNMLCIFVDKKNISYYNKNVFAYFIIDWRYFYD